MAYIKTLKDNELIGGTDNTDVYPVSTTQAIFSQKPDGTLPDGIKHQKLEDRLFDGEEDARELHRKTEKLVPALTYTIVEKDSAESAGTVIKSPVEINGKIHEWNITGNADIITYGDEPAEPVAFADMDVSKLTISSNSAILEEINNWEGNTTYTLPNVVGQYNARFDCTYNNVAKEAAVSISSNLRKFFGFADEAPADVTTLDVSDFSNSVGCTITIPANGQGFKHIYFAVPNNMTITRVVQPDALNAPLAITQIGTVERVINGTSYGYKLYQSTDLIDATEPKRLTIS